MIFLRDLTDPVKYTRCLLIAPTAIKLCVHEFKTIKKQLYQTLKQSFTAILKCKFECHSTPKLL